MPNIIDLIAQDSKASDISQEIKDTLYTKAAEKIDVQKASVGTSMFDTSTPEPETSEEE